MKKVKIFHLGKKWVLADYRIGHDYSVKTIPGFVSEIRLKRRTIFGRLVETGWIRMVTIIKQNPTITITSKGEVYYGTKKNSNTTSKPE